MLDVRRAKQYLFNKKFNVSVNLTQDRMTTIQELSIWKDNHGYMFHLHETNPLILVQSYPYKNGDSTFQMTPQFVEDCVTIQMIQRECWNNG